jgi:hypothetical protein
LRFWLKQSRRRPTSVAEEKSTAKNLATAFALCGLLRDSHDGSVAGEARVISVTKEDTMMSAPYSLAAGGLLVPVQTHSGSNRFGDVMRRDFAVREAER